MNIPITTSNDGAAHVISTAEMKQSDQSTDDTWEESWLCLDPNDLKICIRVLSESIQSLSKDEHLIVGQVIGCMALTLSRSKKQEIRDGNTADDAADSEEAWFCFDPKDLAICIRVLSASIEALSKGEPSVVGKVISCMALALSRSEKQQLRDSIASGDVSAMLSAVGRSSLVQNRFQKRQKRRGTKDKEVEP